MKVLNCGTECCTKLGKIKAIITGICIRYGRDTYELSYFHSEEHKNVWVERDELIISDSKQSTICFVTKDVSTC